MATGYENFGVTKTIALPLPPQKMTIDEYKNRYGIDLRNILAIDENEIYFNTDSLILLKGESGPSLYPGVLVPGAVSIQAYDEGVTDGYLRLYFYASEDRFAYGIEFSIEKDSDLTLDNIKVDKYEN